MTEQFQSNMGKNCIRPLMVNPGLSQLMGPVMQIYMIMAWPYMFLTSLMKLG